MVCNGEQLVGSDGTAVGATMPVAASRMFSAASDAPVTDSSEHLSNRRDDLTAQTSAPTGAGS